jgi:vacuolar-type H+-ATPase subunit H
VHARGGMRTGIFLSMGALMAAHEASTPASGDTVLREIAQKERELQEDLARAQQEAARLIADAEREAEALRSRAGDQVRQEEAAAASASAAEVAAINEQVLARAQQEAGALRQRAEGRLAAAVALVVREVLGERA